MFYDAHDSATANNYLAPDVKGAEVEKPVTVLTALCFLCLPSIATLGVPDTLGL